VTRVPTHLADALHVPVSASPCSPLLARQASPRRRSTAPLERRPGPVTGRTQHSRCVRPHIKKQHQQLQCGALRVMACAGSMQEGRRAWVSGQQRFRPRTCLQQQAPAARGRRQRWPPAAQVHQRGACRGRLQAAAGRVQAARCVPPSWLLGGCWARKQACCGHVRTLCVCCRV
jgi:hypothetical protein